MRVIWKRPDGFHGADPSDFKVVELDGHTTFWLHKSDRQWFPFRISGGWQESEATKRLNALINLLGSEKGVWTDAIVGIFNDTMNDDPEIFIKELKTWVGDLRNHLKGDTWEVDIMNQALQQVTDRLDEITEGFLAKSRG